MTVTRFVGRASAGKSYDAAGAKLTVSEASRRAAEARRQAVFFLANWHGAMSAVRWSRLRRSERAIFLEVAAEHRRFLAAARLEARLYEGLALLAAEGAFHG